MKIDEVPPRFNRINQVSGGPGWIDRHSRCRQRFTASQTMKVGIQTDRSKIQHPDSFAASLEPETFRESLQCGFVGAVEAIAWYWHGSHDRSDIHQGGSTRARSQKLSTDERRRCKVQMDHFFDGLF